MSKVRQILVSAVAAALLGAGLGACGQRGGLYLPTDPAAKGRATLPSLLLPGVGSAAKPGGTSSGNTATTPGAANDGAAKTPAPAASAPAPAADAK